ncbi:MFS transporter [Frondihabitans sucicola]|uniref:MFS transporter n=1 Tax=Frondihabitans sucicola TaxID=1268041 RepID=A0ABN6Y4F8_9MICO|nr:MDR family MFS transporter [Frondihabitans sucicola]BDZ51969.1 MFS transporter [Frondihabitans sucicola]
MSNDTTTAPAVTADSRGASTAPAHDPDAARNRLVLGLLLVSAFVVILNETIMSVALPTLIIDLKISAATAQWLTTGFLLTMAVVIPVTGFLLQRFNTRPVFILAMSLFSAGTLVAAIAPGFPVLLVARVIQASGTAIMMPLLMTTAMTLVAPAARGRVMGNISIVISVAPAIGPTISGLILSALSWRFMFVIVLPIAVAALILGSIKMKNVTVPRKVPLDVLSVILSAFAFAGLLYGLSSVGEAASGSDQPVTPLVPVIVGLVALALFVLRQTRLAKSKLPLLDLRTFLSRTFSISIAMIAVSSIALFGSLIILPIYMQTVLGFNTLTTGLLLLPGGIVMGVLAPFVGRVYDRIGPTALLVVGSILVSGALWAMAMVFRVDTPAYMIPVIHIVLSIGLSMTFTPLFTASLGAVKPELYSHGSAILNTVQQVAAGLGTALFVTLLATGTASRIAAGASQVDATMTGVQTAFLAGAIISLFTIVASFFVRKPAAVDGAPAPVGGH